MPPGRRNAAPPEQGQSLLAFMVLFPVFLICLFMVSDIGRLLYLKNQVRITADATALAAAGAVDLRQTGSGSTCQLNRAWAAARAGQVLAEMQGRIGEDAWMQIQLSQLHIQGCEVRVVISGSGATLFGGYLGLDRFHARALAHAAARITPAGP